MIAKDLISIYRVIKMCDRLCCDFPITKCWLICCFFAAAQRSSNSKTWQVDYRRVFRLMARVWTRYSCCQNPLFSTSKKQKNYSSSIFINLKHSFSWWLIIRFLLKDISCCTIICRKEEDKLNKNKKYRRKKLFKLS